MRIFFRIFIPTLALTFLVGVKRDASAADGPFQGEWRTSLGVVKVDQKGDVLTATFFDLNVAAVKGTVKDKTQATLRYGSGQTGGEADITIDDAGKSFSGTFQYGGDGGRQQPFNGWKPDPLATKGKPGRFGGLWLTSLGLMELNQNDANITGKFALRGGSEIHGEASGGRFDHHFKALLGGNGWFDLSDDGKTLSGAAVDDGSTAWFGWEGRSAPEFARHAKLVAGKTVDGSTNNLLTYSVHAPEGFKPGDARRWPTVVILHGSNMNGRAYVDTIVAAWPEIARDFLILGINGERPSGVGDDPRFNFSYISYVGKSTFGGYPGTDRESPALVSEALTELKGIYPVKHYLVGGHSQGGFLTYSLLMNFPELFAGAFPVSAGLIVQCEPEAYADASVKAAQRRVPLAIIHAKNDPVVGFGMGQYAADLFGEAGWPGFRFFADGQNGHMFGRLPVGPAILWLEALATDDQDALLTFAKTALKEGRDRDALAAANRLRAMMSPDNDFNQVDTVLHTINQKALAGAKIYLPKIKANESNAWVEGFLAYRDSFEFAEGSREVMAAFKALRDRDTMPARTAYNAARQAFQQGRQDDGYAKYQEIVDKHYASPLYRLVKPQLDQRKK